ncbi:MAG: hypothetical protein Q9215_004776 [Flavoplaca cf. flavocitrina]
MVIPLPPPPPPAGRPTSLQRRNTERIQGSSPPPTPPQNRTHGGFRRPFGSYHSYRPSRSQFDDRRPFASNDSYRPSRWQFEARRLFASNDSYRPSRWQFEARRPFASNDGYRQDYAFNQEAPPGPGLERSHDHGQLPIEDLDEVTSVDEVTSESEISDAVSANDFALDGPDPDAGETRTENKHTATTFGGRDITTSLTGRNTDRPSPYSASSLNVLSSRLIGEDVMYGHWTAALSVIAPDSPFQPRKQPLFRWMHLQGESNFSSFIATLEETRRGIIDVNRHPQDWQNLVENAKEQKLLHLAIRPRRPTIAGSTPAQPQDMAGSRSVTFDREYRIADSELPNPEDKMERPRESAKNDNADVQFVGIDEFHLFYLAAVPTLHADKNSPTVDGRERKQKAAIYLFLNHRRLLLNTNQVQAYMKRKNKIGQRAFAQCPCHSLDDVEALAAESHSETNGSDSEACRGHQEKILSVREEISCVLTVLETQERLIKGLLSTLSRRRMLYAKSDLWWRREVSILQHCFGKIRDKTRDFDAMDEQAIAMRTFNLDRIESNKDRQENAILIFTFVTIIFLPLSFVSSFFGINTSDIRDMATPQ